MEDKTACLITSRPCTIPCGRCPSTPTEAGEGKRLSPEELAEISDLLTPPYRTNWQAAAQLVQEVKRLQERNAMLGGELDDTRRDMEALLAELAASRTREAETRQEADRIRNAAARHEYQLINILGPVLGFPTGPFPEVCGTCQGGPCPTAEACSNDCLSAPYVSDELAATLVQRYEEAREQIPQSWEGDGGIGAMQSLAHYFWESGHKNAYQHIRAAAHHQGWCIDDGGADRMVLVNNVCPLCEHRADTPPTPVEEGGQGNG